MTSAAPARKPYRKAPPQHRESRHSQPTFREDLSGNPAETSDSTSPAQHVPSQVNCLHDDSSISQHAHFTSPYPKCSEDLEGPDACSSSWSDSELDISSLSSLDLIVLPPPRIFSHGAVGATPPPKSRGMGMNRFISRSEDLLLKSNEKRPSWKGSQHRNRCTSPAHSSRSGERSLVFKEEAEIFDPRVKQHPSKSVYPTQALPTKGILKQAQYLGEHPKDSLRKSKSAEMLGMSRSHKRKPKSRSLDQERKPGVSPPVHEASASSSSPNSVLPEWKVQLLEEKLKFSQFLDEITCRVLSPASLNLLGYKKQESSKGIQSLPSPCQQTDPKDHQGKKQERRRPWSECATPQHGERRTEKNDWSITKRIPLKKDDLVQKPEKWPMDPKAEPRKSEGPDCGRIGLSGDGRHGSETECDGRNQQGVHQQPPSHQSAQLEPKDRVNKSGPTKAGTPTIYMQSKNMPVSQTDVLVLSQIKVRAPIFPSFSPLCHCLSKLFFFYVT